MPGSVAEINEKVRKLPGIVPSYSLHEKSIVTVTLMAPMKIILDDTHC